jgi:staphylococcal nuclease domain-containing protein 1
VHTYTAEALPYGRELMAAEEEAKKERKNVSEPVHPPQVVTYVHALQIWAEYTGEEVEAEKEADTSAALAPEYLDVFVSAVRESDPFGFSVQILDDSSE